MLKDAKLKTVLSVPATKPISAPNVLTRREEFLLIPSMLELAFVMEFTSNNLSQGNVLTHVPQFLYNIMAIQPPDSVKLPVRLDTLLLMIIIDANWTAQQHQP